MVRKKLQKESELERLRQEIQDAKAKQYGKDKVEVLAVRSSPLWLSGLEIVVATGIGGVIGYFLDKFFHTQFIMIVFILLGALAGWNNIARSVQIKVRDEKKK